MQLCQQLADITGEKQPQPNQALTHVTTLVSCLLLLQFPTLPLVGKLNTAKPLPVFESRVDEAGNIEVLV